MSVIVILGPTGSGKTSISIKIAKAIGGEIISADSRAIYKGMDIGTAKPTTAEMQGVPHYGLDLVYPGERFTVADWKAYAEAKIRDIKARGKVPIIVGGTGLYMDSLIRGNDFAPFPSTGMRQQLEQEPIEDVYARLSVIDPETAGRLHLSDKKRIIRAMEVYLETGKTMTEHNLQTQSVPPKYTPVWFALEDEDRADLYHRIDMRVGKMLKMGLIEEIQTLLAEGIPPKCTAMQAIGYKEFVDALEGRCTIDEAADQVRQSSRRYAKRQLTWLRRNSAIHWLHRNNSTGNGEILSAARQVLQESDN